MNHGMRIISVVLALLLALSGGAAAQAGTPCPECDPDGPDNPENSYSDLDVGVVTDEAEALVDGDASSSHTNEEGGPWAWLTICLTAIVHKVNEMLGTDLEVKSTAEVFVSTEGVDVDANVQGTEFDDSPVGQLDDATWQVMGDANAALDEAGLTPDWQSLPEADAPSVDVDVCIVGELVISDC